MTPRDHIATLPRDWTPEQDWVLWSGLNEGYGIIAVSYAVGKHVTDVGARFHAMTDPFKVDGTVPDDVQEEIARVLRGRLN